MLNAPILYPLYYRVIRREGTRWLVKGARLDAPNSLAHGLHDADRYGLTNEAIVTALFRLRGGKAGYYLANLKDKRYCYCGESLEDVRAEFQRLGIGRDDPMEGVR